MRMRWTKTNMIQKRSTNGVSSSIGTSMGRRGNGTRGGRLHCASQFANLLHSLHHRTRRLQKVLQFVVKAAVVSLRSGWQDGIHARAARLAGRNRATTRSDRAPERVRNVVTRVDVGISMSVCAQARDASRSEGRWRHASEGADSRAKDDFFGRRGHNRVHFLRHIEHRQQ